MNILFTICGRSGSKGIKNKNCRDFLGKPLVYYTIDVISQYQKNHCEDHHTVALNTDSYTLKNIVDQQTMCEIEYVLRKEELAGDDVSKVAVIADTLNQLEEKKKCQYEMVVDLDITSPLRTVKDLEHLIEKKMNSNCDAVFSVTEARRNPYFNMVKKTEKGYERVITSNYTARQQAPEIYDMNASLYAYSPDFLKCGKGLFEGQCEIIIMKDTGVLDLDRESDFELMEAIGRYYFA